MKAAIINQFGSPEVLEYTDVPQPSVEKDQVLIQVRASSINPVDWKIRKGMFPLPFAKFPKILGCDLAGEVVEVGEKVTRFQPGDRVYTFVDPLKGGAYAEYIAVAESLLCLQPTNLNDEEAAAVPLAASTALQALRDVGQIKNGQKVLINGASGGVGTFAVQIANGYKAEVTAVCSGKNANLVQQLGADKIIDYTQQDFTQLSQSYDIIFDVVSNRSFSECEDSLSPQGIYITLLPGIDIFLQSFLTFFSSKKAKLHFAQPKSSDLEFLKGWIEENKIKPVIDRTYPLSDIKAAHAYSETGRAIGKIALSIIESRV